MSPDNCPGYFWTVKTLLDGRRVPDQMYPCACTLARQAAQLKAALPPKYRLMTFDAFQIEAGNRDACELARQFAADPWGNGWYWLVLIGLNGRGKTHLAAAIVNALLERGEPACFEVVPDLLDHLRAGYGAQAEAEHDTFDQRLERVKKAPVLVLDDLGAESNGRQNTPWAVTWSQDKLYQILDYRLVNELPTVVTTNVLFEPTPQCPVALPPRIASRLQDRQVARVKSLQTGDWRKKA